jgi:MFS family permease
MGDFFNVSGDLTNLTLILFFLFFALGILFWGPLSDKYGRRPILLLGLSIYIVASVSCALSANITQLIISRILQASGGSAATAVATAMVKDVYSGRKREAVLSLVQIHGRHISRGCPVLGAFYASLHFVAGAFLGTSPHRRRLLSWLFHDGRNNFAATHWNGSGVDASAWNRAEKPQLSCASAYFLACKHCYACLYFQLFLHLPAWLWAFSTVVQFLLCHKRRGLNHGADALPLAFKILQP